MFAKSCPRGGRYERVRTEDLGEPGGVIGVVPPGSIIHPTASGLGLKIPCVPCSRQQRSEAALDEDVDNRPRRSLERHEIPSLLVSCLYLPRLVRGAACADIPLPRPFFRLPQDLDLRRFQIPIEALGRCCATKRSRVPPFPPAEGKSTASPCHLPAAPRRALRPLLQEGSGEHGNGKV